LHSLNINLWSRVFKNADWMSAHFDYYDYRKFKQIEGLIVDAGNTFVIMSQYEILYNGDPALRFNCIRKGMNCYNALKL
jgi:hypothetical protein